MFVSVMYKKRPIHSVQMYRTAFIIHFLHRFIYVGYLFGNRKSTLTALHGKKELFCNQFDYRDHVYWESLISLYFFLDVTFWL